MSETTSPRDPAPIDLPGGATFAQSDSWLSSEPELSLVTATLGDPAGVRSLVESLNDEWDSGVNFEFLLMDQDSAERSLPALRLLARFPWLYVSYPGALNANIRRNLGVGLARGQLIGFPMDDSRYTGTTLLTLCSMARAQPDVAGFCGRIIDTTGRPAVLRWPRRSTRVTRWNHHRTAIGPGMFLRRKTIDAVGTFPLDLGLGVTTWYWSGDDSDLALRIAAYGPLIYEPSLEVIDTDPTESDIARRLRYGGGTGEVLRRAELPRFFRDYLIVRKLAHVWFDLLLGHRVEARGHAAWARGVVFGYRRALPDEFATREDTGPRLSRLHRLRVRMSLVAASLVVGLAAVVHGIAADRSTRWLVAPSAVALVALLYVFASPLGWRVAVGD